MLLNCKINLCLPHDQSELSCHHLFPILPLANTHSRTCALKHSGVTVTVSLGKRLHHAVDLLSLSRQPEAPQKLPESLNQVQVCELV